MKFELLHTDSASKARTGRITTDHGVIETPIFMPVGTAGTVKAVHQRELENDIKAQIILGNTYHLYLRPGLEVLEKAGGLHRFNGWHRPVDQQSSPTQFGMHGVKLEADELDGATSLSFTFYFTDRKEWLGQDFSVPLGSA